MVYRFDLCPKLSGLQQSQTDCILLENQEVCACKHNADAYNMKVKSFLAHLENYLPSYIIVDKGRTQLEKSCILVDKGVFYGMGYLAPHQIPLSMDKAKEILKPYPSYQFI